MVRTLRDFKILSRLHQGGILRDPLEKDSFSLPRQKSGLFQKRERVPGGPIQT